MTGVGVLLGTAAYMAPEQARGKPADKRSDIWSFGCVLYEMLAGTRAFPGPNVTETFVSILSQEPAWSALPARTSALIRRLLRRCLDKDRKRRLDSAADVASVVINGSTPTLGTPVMHFPTRIVGGGIDAGQGRQYDVGRNGRLLFVTELDDPTPITLLQNWKPDRTK